MAIARMVIQMDVSDVLPTIRVPTLVLHKRDDQAVPLEEGKYIADHIPGAKFVELPGGPITGRGADRRKPSRRSRNSSPGCATAPSRIAPW